MTDINAEVPVIEEAVDSPETIENESEPEVKEEPEGEVSSPDELGEDELPEEFSKRVGPILAAERKRERAKISHEIETLRSEINRLSAGQQPNYYPQSNNTVNGAIQDPMTGQWVAVDSVEGVVIRREQQRELLNNQSKANDNQAKQTKVIEAFQDKVQNGYLKYNNFDQCYDVVDKGASHEMAMAMTGTSNPASIINYLGKNPVELSRIRALSPIEQQKEIYRLEDKLLPKQKLVSKASSPTGTPTSVSKPNNDAGLSYIERRKVELRQKQKR